VAYPEPHAVRNDGREDTAGTDTMLCDWHHGEHESKVSYRVIFIDCVNASLREYGLRLLSFLEAGGPK
jgi:hypothetical protein